MGCCICANVRGVMSWVRRSLARSVLVTNLPPLFHSSPPHHLHSSPTPQAEYIDLVRKPVGGDVCMKSAKLDLSKGINLDLIARLKLFDQVREWNVPTTW